MAAVTSMTGMDLLTGYDTRAVDDGGSRGLGLGGLDAAAAVDRMRRSRQPRKTTFLDERRRSSGPTGPGGPGTYQAGLFGEEVVSDALQRDGWRVVGHRVRTRVGEIDLVARRGSTVIFAEVKTAGPGRLGVEDSVGARQRHRIRRAAIAWMAANPRLQRGVRCYRFDVFLVRRDEHGSIAKVDHVRDAF